MPVVMGTMMTGDADRAKKLGVMIHYLVMGTVVFGVIYAVLFRAFDSASWIVGVAIGAAHGFIVGAMAMPMMPALHPRMTASAADAPAFEVVDGNVELSEPGFFGVSWGSMTPIGIIMGHAVFGLIAALVYGAST
jgi:uncharacterized membrane protein YagU involved in acid resistance